MQKESNIQKSIMLAVSKVATIFRNNTGVAWVGEVVKKWKDTQGNRYLTIKNYRPFHGGLIKGSSDLIGWKPVVITQDMVGKKIAAFVALEVKSKEGRLSEQQVVFLENVTNDGGIAGVAKNNNEALDIIKNSGDYSNSKGF